MPNPLYVNIHDMLMYFADNILNEHELILFQTVKWFRALLCITNNSIKHQSFVYTQLNDQRCLFITIRFNKIIRLH